MDKIKQISIRSNRATREKLLFLKERFGSFSAAVTIAVDRLYRTEILNDAAQDTTPPPPQKEQQ